eukprot:3079490-Prymnesium_polylepis.1
MALSAALSTSVLPSSNSSGLLGAIASLSFLRVNATATPTEADTHADPGATIGGTAQPSSSDEGLRQVPSPRMLRRRRQEGLQKYPRPFAPPLSSLRLCSHSASHSAPPVQRTHAPLTACTPRTVRWALPVHRRPSPPSSWRSSSRSRSSFAPSASEASSCSRRPDRWPTTRLRCWRAVRTRCSRLRRARDGGSLACNGRSPRCRAFAVAPILRQVWRVARGIPSKESLLVTPWHGFSP